MTTSTQAARISDTAMTILKKRYLSNGESVEGMFQRVAGGNEKFYNLLHNLRFLPNSPTLFNMGLNNGCTSSACFVFDIQDSMFGPGSIVETRAKAIAVAKAGGGVGYYGGYLRGKGAPIKSIHRVACGPVAVMRDLHGVSRLITQGGKRELAQMFVLPVWHSDIQEFIHCKDEDPQGLSSFNISIGWTQVAADRSVYALHCNEVEKSLWNEQCESAWRTGCPGMFFTDTVNRTNFNKHLGTINSPNPCVTGDTLILTKDGWRRIDTLVGVKTEVWNGQEWSEVEPKVTGHNKPIVRVTLEDGNYLDCTLNHRFFLADGTKVSAAGLQPGDTLEKYGLTEPAGDLDTTQTMVAYLDGFYHADGFYDNGKEDHRITFYDDQKIDIGEELERAGLVRLQPYDQRNNRRRGVLNVVPAPKGDVPMEESIGHRLSWLAGLMDGDGCVVYSDKSRRSYSYQISSIDQDFLRRVGLLLRTLGVPSRVGKSHEPSRKKFKSDIERACQGCYVLCIGTTGAVRLAEMGLPCRRLTTTDNHPQRESLRFPRVASIMPRGMADTVYCFTESRRNRGVFNGILCANCGETPNRSDEPCNLGSIALPKYFFGGNRSINWNMLEEDIYTATLFLDDILDRNEFPHPDITAAALLTRKLGLGVMGWADLLAMMHLHYDSEEAVALGRKVAKFFQDVSHQASEDMVHKFNKEPYAGYDSVKSETPCRRNETTGSIAPTGTIALIADLFFSQSIEPHPFFAYERTTAEGIKLREEMDLNKFDGFVPKIAHDIHWSWHVKHQAAFQEFTDLGVSKTINMPNEATIQDVSDAYRLMYETGCKGGTIFRDGCRNEQVMVKKESRSVFSTNGVSRNGDHGDQVQKDVVETPRALLRRLPDRRNSITHKFRIQGKSVYLTVGLYDDGAPAEIFITTNKLGSSMQGMVAAWGMVFSVALQSGMPLERLVRKHTGMRFEPSGLTGNPEIPTCSSIPDYVVRWLSREFLHKDLPAPKEVEPPKVLASSILESGESRLESGTDASTDSGMWCEQCGAEALYQAGCLVCRDPTCAWTRCS
jgi:ribonucleoside-diphosphate reductase alpha chain